MPMKLIGVKEASQSINIRIKRGASMWLRIFGGGKFHSFLPTGKGEPLKLCSSPRCSSVLSPCLQAWRQKGRSLLKRRERELPTFISPTPKFSKEKSAIIDVIPVASCCGDWNMWLQGCFPCQFVLMSGWRVLVSAHIGTTEMQKPVSVCVSVCVHARTCVLPLLGHSQKPSQRLEK